MYTFSSGLCVGVLLWLESQRVLSISVKVTSRALGQWTCDVGKVLDIRNHDISYSGIKLTTTGRSNNDRVLAGPFTHQGHFKMTTSNIWLHTLDIQMANVQYPTNFRHVNLPILYTMATTKRQKINRGVYTSWDI